jgi:predicted amidohydrolase YtcJ
MITVLSIFSVILVLLRDGEPIRSNDPIGSRPQRAGVGFQINARTFTGISDRPYVEAIALKGPRIVAIGTNQEISSIAGPTTRSIDLKGHLVIPGINDSHVHFQEDTIGARVDFGSMEPTCAHALAVVKQEANKVPAGTLISGTIGPEAFFDPGCTAAALDRAAPGDAVVLGTWTPHAAILNQNAAKRFGIDTSAPPPLASWYGKDLKSKQWDGVVQQSASFRWGVTSVTLIEFHPGRRVEQDQNRRRKPQHPPIPTRLSDRVTVSGEKWLLDSGMIERSGAMRAPYTDDPSTSGQIDFPPGEMRAIVEEARQ